MLKKVATTRQPLRHAGVQILMVKKEEALAFLSTLDRPSDGITITEPRSHFRAF